MLKIGEFSKLVRVSARMLRHYEKCGLFYPMKTDPITGYRFYSAGQIPLLGRIIALRDMGFSTNEIGELLPRLDDASYMESVLAAQIKTIAQAIAGEESKLAKIAAMRALLMKEEGCKMIYEVELKELPMVNVLSLRETIPAYDQEGRLWEKLGKFMAQNGIPCDDGGYSLYHDEEYKETDVDVEIAVPVRVPGANQGAFVYKELEAIQTAATIRFSGPYENYTPAMEKLSAWMEQNGYEFSGSVRGKAIVTAKDQSDPKNYLTELQAPVRKK